MNWVPGNIMEIGALMESPGVERRDAYHLLSHGTEEARTFIET